MTRPESKRNPGTDRTFSSRYQPAISSDEFYFRFLKAFLAALDEAYLAPLDSSKRRPPQETCPGGTPTHLAIGRIAISKTRVQSTVCPQVFSRGFHANGSGSTGIAGPVGSAICSGSGTGNAAAELRSLHNSIAVSVRAATCLLNAFSSAKL